MEEVGVEPVQESYVKGNRGGVVGLPHHCQLSPLEMLHDSLTCDALAGMFVLPGYSLEDKNFWPPPWFSLWRWPKNSMAPGSWKPN